MHLPGLMDATTSGLTVLNQSCFLLFMDENAHKIRVKAVQGDTEAFSQYGMWIHNVCAELPCVFHYSWYDIKRKIGTYKNYWSRHWQSLYDLVQEDTVENNMFFDKKWSEVSSSDIDNLAEKLEDKMGGWVFHRKVDFSSPTPSIKFGSDHPECIKSWLSK